MFGVLRLSRALADRRLADEILDQGIENALTLLDAIALRCRITKP
jgi:hypothetical protein